MTFTTSDFRNAPAVYQTYDYGLENCAPIPSSLLKDAWTCQGVIEIAALIPTMVNGVKEMAPAYGRMQHTLSLQDLKGGKIFDGEICCVLPPTDGSSNQALLACESANYPNGRPWCESKDLTRVFKENGWFWF